MEKAIDLTHQMVQLAESGDWESVISIEQERSAFIRSFFLAYQGTRTKLLESQANTIQTLDKNILLMALSAKDGLRLEMAQAHQTRRAVAAYAGR